MQEAPESVLSERDFLWEKCNFLYNVITQNGMLTAATFRQAVGIAGNLFKDKVDMSMSNNWFSAIADFLDMMETARKQKVGPKC